MRLSRRSFAGVTLFGVAGIAAAAPDAPRDASTAKPPDPAAHTDTDAEVLAKLDLLFDLAVLEEWDPVEDLPLPVSDSASDPDSSSDPALASERASASDRASDPDSPQPVDPPRSATQRPPQAPPRSEPTPPEIVPSDGGTRR